MIEGKLDLLIKENNIYLTNQQASTDNRPNMQSYNSSEYESLAKPKKSSMAPSEVDDPYQPAKFQPHKKHTAGSVCSYLSNVDHATEKRFDQRSKSRSKHEVQENDITTKFEIKHSKLSSIIIPASNQVPTPQSKQSISPIDRISHLSSNTKPHNSALDKHS